MRLLFFVPEPLPTFRADVAVLFGQALPRRGIETHLVGPRGDADPQPADAAQVSVPAPSRGGRVWRGLLFGWHCLRMLVRQGRRADLIQVRDMVPMGLLALAWARIVGRPFVYWMSYLMSEGRIERATDALSHRSTPWGRLRAWLVLTKGRVERRLLYRVLLPRCDHVFVQSDAMKRFVASQGIAADAMTAVPMGVDCERLRPEVVPPRRLPGWEAVPLIAYLGTLDRIRRIDALIEVLRRVRERHPTARLLLIGDAPTAETAQGLRSRARALGLGDAVHITGWLPVAQAWSLLAGADVAVSYFPRGPILDTNSPTKLLEYLALAVPCVGNDNPDQAWVLQTSQAGVLTDSTVDALAQGVTAVLAAPDAARARASGGPPFIRRERSYDVIGERVAAAYRAIADARALPVGRLS